MHGSVHDRQVYDPRVHFTQSLTAQTNANAEGVPSVTWPTARRPLLMRRTGAQASRMILDRDARSCCCAHERRDRALQVQAAYVGGASLYLSKLRPKHAPRVVGASSCMQSCSLRLTTPPHPIVEPLDTQERPYHTVTIIVSPSDIHIERNLSRFGRGDQVDLTRVVSLTSFRRCV